jgi:hypothetical protein
MAIPPWDARQVLPPNDIVNPVGPLRSPYPATLTEFVDRFATSWQRCKILDGFLEFRAELHAHGALAGFQWLDGSFAENIESLEGRSPKDVDCVTFLWDPQGTIGGAMPEFLIDHDVVHAFRMVDHYWVELNMLGPAQLVQNATYWYSVWSHRRNQVWKGFVEVDLAPLQDQDARNLLMTRWGNFTAPPIPGAHLLTLTQP